MIADAIMIDDVKLASANAEVFGLHFWKTPVNVAGVASGFLAFAVRHASAGSTFARAGVRHAFVEPIRFIEQTVFAQRHRPVDRSQVRGVDTELEDGVWRFRALSQRLRDSGDESPLKAGTELITTALHVLAEAPERVQEDVYAVLEAGLALGLEPAILRRAARPWLFRDDHPTDDRSYAFEAALLVGERDFAYDVFDLHQIA